MIHLLSKYPQIRHVLRVCVAILLTVAIYYFLYPKALGLMLFSTVFVMLTSTGSAFFQGLLRFFMLVVLAVAARMFFPYVVNFYNNMDVILCGSLVGVLTNTLIFSDRIDLEFKKAVIPLLRASRDYFSTIIFYLIDQNQDRMSQMDQEKIHFQSKLLLLPVWIYQPGFDSTLQKGYRYYFMQLNHLAEILFAMHYLVRFSYDKAWITNIESSLLQCDQGMNEFVTAITTLLYLEKLKEGVVDFEGNIHDMELIFNKIIAMPMELLETYSNAKYLAEFVHNLRELRSVLIQLAKALR